MRSGSGRGVERGVEKVATAFRAEVAYYRPHALEGRDAPSLAALRRECVRVFLAALRAPLEPGEFVDDFVGSLVFEAVEGAAEAVTELRARDLRLGVVANWDCALPDHLAALGFTPLFDTVVTSARAGAAKPDPAIFELALAELGTRPDRTLHVGDEPLDEEGAREAGLRFTPAPLATAFAGWS